MDLYDTSRRPGGPGFRCESCGVEGDDLAVHTADLAVIGVACLTLCPRCARSGVVPPVSVSTAVRLVAQHAEHLGIDLDQIAEALGDQ